MPGARAKKRDVQGSHSIIGPRPVTRLHLRPIVALRGWRRRPSQKTLRIDVDCDFDPAARRRRGGEERAQETLQVGRSRRLGGEAEAVAPPQDRYRRLSGAEEGDLVIARMPADRRDPPAFAS